MRPVTREGIIYGISDEMNGGGNADAGMVNAGNSVGDGTGSTDSGDGGNLLDLCYNPIGKHRI